MNRVIGSSLVVLGYLYGVDSGVWDPHFLMWVVICLYWLIEHIIYWKKNIRANKMMFVLDLVVAVVLLFVTIKLFG